MTDTTYNGWTNRSTWALALHLDNNEGDHNYWRERTTEHYDSTAEYLQLAADEDPGASYDEVNVRNDAAYLTANELESWLDELYESIETAATDHDSKVTREAWLLLKDVGFDTSTTAINYHEIARHWVDEVATEAGQ
ncbi:MAG: hypothetical protein GY941_09870 [Planctomycetes bacterium]|nr:hypothetical protein [Planctomycetota bacterium]